MERIEGDQGEEEKMGLEHLPSALLATIIAKLDMASICSVASTCRTFKSCASHILTFLPTVHLMVKSQSLFIYLFAHLC